MNMYEVISSFLSCHVYASELCDEDSIEYFFPLNLKNNPIVIHSPIETDRADELSLI